VDARDKHGHDDSVDLRTSWKALRSAKFEQPWRGLVGRRSASKDRKRREAADKDTAPAPVLAPLPDCPWRPCIARRRYRISPAASRRRRSHCRRRWHCRRLGRCRRPTPPPALHVPPPIRSPRRQARRAPCQRPQFRPRPDWPLRRATGSRSPVAPNPDSTDRPAGKTRMSFPCRARR